MRKTGGNHLTQDGTSKTNASFPPTHDRQEFETFSCLRPKEEKTSTERLLPYAAEASLTVRQYTPPPRHRLS
ncbi:MAG: hypothetical protein OJF52_003376 [Nitrospira sp.]|nr:MAG: hypothetical protein OJF52_003376 [Nitrospira sp.]